MSEARIEWAQAAAKAKRVPTDKGLVLQVEGLARSDACQDIGAPLAQARAKVTDQVSRERIELARGSGQARDEAEGKNSYHQIP